jgi:hypothetical protein
MCGARYGSGKMRRDVRIKGLLAFRKQAEILEVIKSCLLLKVWKILFNNFH